MNLKDANLPTQRIMWMFCLIGLVYLASCLISDPSFAVTVQNLQAPMRQLKTDIFGGWMMAVKIVAAATGVIISAVRASLVPFGIGAGLSIGIHFFDTWLGDGAAGALI